MAVFWWQAQLLARVGSSSGLMHVALAALVLRLGLLGALAPLPATRLKPFLLLPIDLLNVSAPNVAC